MLPPVLDEWDRQERRAAMYLAAMNDGMVGMINEYPVSVDVEEIVRLPGTGTCPKAARR